MKSKTILILVVLTLCMCLVFTACNKDSKNKETKEYTVTFMNGDATVSTQKVEQDKTASAPTDSLTKENYTFAGWFATLNADGTGSGTAFDFSTKITGDLTLYAAFTENNNVDVFFIGKDATLQKVYEGDKFVPANVGENACYDFSGYYAFVLKRDRSGFVLPEKFMYRDITALVDSDDIIVEQFYTYYYFYDTELELEYANVVYNDGRIAGGVSDLKNNGAEFFLFGQTIVYTYYDGNNEIIVIIENGVSQAYVMVGYFDFGDEIIMDAAFIEEFCVDGRVILDYDDATLKADYVNAFINTDSDQFEFIFKKDDVIDLSKFDREGFTASYTYEKYNEADEFLYSEVLGESFMNAYLACMADEYRQVVNGDDAALDALFEESGLSYSVSGYLDNFYAYLYLYDSEADVTVCYWINFDDGKFYYCSYLQSIEGVDSEYIIGYDAVSGEWLAFFYEEAEWTGNTIPAEQFRAMKLIGSSLHITINYEAVV